MKDNFTPRNTARANIEVKVNLEFEKFSGFITEYSSNISEGGMFIKTDDLKPLGTILSFEFNLKDNFKLIQGLGEVVWVRTQTQGPDRPQGMGIRFHEIDEKSRELIRTMVERHAKEGGNPFSLDIPPSASPVIPSIPKAQATQPEAEVGPIEPSQEVELDNLFVPPPTSRGEKTTVEHDPTASVKDSDFPALFADSEPIHSSDGEHDTGTNTAVLRTYENESRSGQPVERAGRDDLKDFGIVIEEENFSTDSKLSDQLEPEEPTVRSSVARFRKFKWIPVAIAALAVPVGAWKFFHSRQTKVAIPLKPVVTVQPTLALETTAAPTIAPTVVPTTIATLAPEPTAKPEPTPTTEPTVKPETKAKTSKPFVRSSNPVSELVKISSRKNGSQTWIEVQGRGNFTNANVIATRIDAHPPRELIRILGVAKPYRQKNIAVHTTQVKQIRTGFHSTPEGNELHIVIDLTSAKSKVLDVETTGSRALIRVGTVK